MPVPNITLFKSRQDRKRQDCEMALENRIAVLGDLHRNSNLKAQRQELDKKGRIHCCFI